MNSILSFIVAGTFFYLISGKFDKTLEALSFRSKTDRAILNALESLEHRLSELEKRQNGAKK